MKITIYTTPTCVYCKATKKFLAENNVDFEEKDVTSDDVARAEMIDKSGQMGVPVIEIDDEIVVGFNKKRLVELLKLELDN